MFYLLHGNDEFSSREQLRKLRHQGNFEYNQETYSGGDVDFLTLTTTCNTFPFLTDQRLVVLDGLPKRKRGEEAREAAEASSSKESTDTDKPKKGKKGSKSKSAQNTRAGFEKALAEYIPQIPDFTIFILVLDEALDASHILVKAAQNSSGQVIQSTLPKGAGLETWINKRAKSIGVKIEPDATSLLANFIGPQLRLLANELDKLSIYVGEGATIRADDVRLLSAHVQEARIFDLTDALAQRNRKQALDILHDLLKDGEPPLKLISTITSQVRSLLIVKDLAQKGLRSSQIAAAAGMAPFVAEKALRQIGKFSPAQLESAYRQLLATDTALKRSRMSPEMALDLLVVQFGNDK
jgi:DNA polymerase-3 subunit delta